MSFSFTSGGNQPSRFTMAPMAPIPESLPVSALDNPSSSLWDLDGDEPPPPPSLTASASFSSFPPPSLAASASFSSFHPPLLSLAREYDPPPSLELVSIHAEDRDFYSHLPYYFDHCLEVVDEENKPFVKGESSDINIFLDEMVSITYENIIGLTIRRRFNPDYVQRFYKNPVSKKPVLHNYVQYVEEQDRIIHRELIKRERIRFFEHAETLISPHRNLRDYKINVMYYMLWVMKQLFRMYDHVQSGSQAKLFDESFLSLSFLDFDELSPIYTMFSRREALIQTYLSETKVESKKAVERVILAKLMKTWAARVMDPYFRIRPDSNKNNITTCIVNCITIESMILWLCTLEANSQTVDRLESNIATSSKNRDLRKLGLPGPDVLRNILSFVAGKRTKTKKRNRKHKKSRGNKGKSNKKIIKK
jgi:hypothetical protein